MSAPKISLSLVGARQGSPTSTNGVKRSRAVALDEDDEEHERYARAEKVSHFDRRAGGAIDEDNRKDDRPLVIARQANRDWREAANQRKRQRSTLPDAQSESQVMQASIAEESRTTYGLNVFKKNEESPKTIEISESLVKTGQTSPAEAGSRGPMQDAPLDSNGRTSIGKKTEDEVALDALLGRTTEDRSLIVPNPGPTMSETDAFRNDFSSAPPMASLDDYARVPVDRFGAALLRGMGWKDGEGIGSQRGLKIKKETTKPPDRRPALLGIGAKDDAAITQELGAWGKGARGGKGEIKIYNPVLLKDKKTGELFTEDELKQKQEREEKAGYEEEFDRKSREKSRRRDGDEHRADRDKHMDDGRWKNKDRERRKHDEESDGGYYRRKEKEHRRRYEHTRDDRTGSDFDRDRNSSRRDRKDRDRDDRRGSYREGYRDHDRRR